MLNFYESGKRQPSLRRLTRLCSVYRLDVFDVLIPVARQVRRAAAQRDDQITETSQLERAFEALMMFCGVLPDEVRPLDEFSADRSSNAEIQGEHGQAGEIDEIREISAVEVDTDLTEDLCAPLGEVLRYRREDDPIRIKGGRQLRKEYEAGASIRDLSIRHKMAFGTVRTLLLEVETSLRGPGGAHTQEAAADQASSS